LAPIQANCVLRPSSVSRNAAELCRDGRGLDPFPDCCREIEASAPEYPKTRNSRSDEGSRTSSDSEGLAYIWLTPRASRDNIAQAKPVSVPLPYPTQAEEVGQEEQVEFVPATVGFAEGKAQEEPKDIIAAQIRSQGYACNSTQSAERDAEASTANEAVWMLRCQNASYRVTLIPNLAAKVEKVGEEVRREVQKVTAPADNPPAIAGSQ